MAQRMSPDRAPQLRRRKGSIEPESVPQSTTPTSEIPTVRATSGQCDRTVSVMQKLFADDRPQSYANNTDGSQNQAERKAGLQLLDSSLATNRAKSIRLDAMARIIRVEACDPELPPLEMIKRQEQRQHKAAFSSLLL